MGETLQIICADKTLTIENFNIEENVDKYEMVGIFHSAVFLKDTCFNFPGNSQSVLAMQDFYENGKYPENLNISTLIEIYVVAKRSFSTRYAKLYQETEALITQRVNRENANRLMHELDLFKPLNLRTELERSIDDVVLSILVNSRSYSINEAFKKKFGAKQIAHFERFRNANVVEVFDTN
ncbi:hypothetical protein HDE_04746 [Halotydeus destructor]|nr:hypothetical protein HDE_04746 [Halotydeus destructor]